MDYKILELNKNMIYFDEYIDLLCSRHSRAKETVDIENIKKEILNNNFFVKIIFYKNKISGFVSYYYCFNSYSEKQIFLVTIFVKEECRRNGLATLLIESLKNKKMNIRTFVTLGNTVSEDMFSKNNFDIIENYIVWRSKK